MKSIHFYKTGDDYGCFSNFSSHTIIIDDVEWRTSEHYFQAMKFLDIKIQNKAREIISPMEVAKFGRDRKLPLRPDWESIKDDVMRKAILAKVTQNQEVFDTLWNTGSAVLVEHTRNDHYWADGGDGSGKNMLGIILMEVRAKMRQVSQQIKIIKGDITTLNVDTIVNAANKSLVGGGGVDGAIHRVAGPELKLFCAKYKGCKTGEARVSAGFNLPAKFVVHAVGPVWYGGIKNEDSKLYEAYKNSLIVAAEIQSKQVAFPNISTGAFRFPFDRATKIQRYAITSYLMIKAGIENVVIVCFSNKDLERVQHNYKIKQNENYI